MSLHTLDDWENASAHERARVVASTLQGLGAAWRRAPSAADSSVVRLIHSPTGFSFVLVPGGTMSMGLAPAELGLIELYLGRRQHIVEQVSLVERHARPVCQVQVVPFLCGERLLEKPEVARWLTDGDVDPVGAVHRKDALSIATRAGFRLPSDAELEWLARQGRQAPFALDCVFEAPEDDEAHVLVTDPPIRPRLGVADLFATQWAADDWLDTHEGRPENSAARREGDPEGVRRFEEFYLGAVGGESVISQLSARRDRGRGWRARVRFALDLPVVA